MPVRNRSHVILSLLAIFSLMATVRLDAQSVCLKHEYLDELTDSMEIEFKMGSQPSATGKRITWDLDSNSIIGRQRELTYNFTRQGSANNIKTSIFSDYRSFTVATPGNVTPYQITLTYDGQDTAEAVDASGTNGFKAKDFSKYESFAISIKSTDLGYIGNTSNLGKFTMKVRMFSGEAQYTEFSKTITRPELNVEGNLQKINLDASSIVNTGTSGSADLTKVTAVMLTFTTDQPGLDYTFDQLYFYCPGLEPMPVTFSKFEGESVNGNTRLFWQTSTEVDNKGFAVQRKTGNGTFQTIGFVPAGSSQSDVTKDYAFTDNSVPAGASYYRLEQIDNSGKTQYSRIIAVSNSAQGGAGLSISIYPTPMANGKVNVTTVGSKGPLSFTLLNVQGNVVRTWAKGNYTELKMNNVAPGLYILKVMDESGNQNTTKVVIN